MKKQIRKNGFETNSSSTHAICISKNNDYEKRDYIEFEIGEFGWEFDIHQNIHQKASYLITAILGRADKNFADEKLEQLRIILERNNIEYKLPEELKVKSYDWNGRCYFYYDIDGYIDHVDETEKFVNAVLSDDDTFMRYMFGDSFIVTGNDNNNEPFCDYMYEYLGEEETKWGNYKQYGGIKKEFENYEVFEKGN